MSMDSIMHTENGYNGYRAPSVMSIEDAETRAAAEALSGLRSAGMGKNYGPHLMEPATHADLSTPDFLRSPSTRSTTVQPLTYEPQPPTPVIIKQEEQTDQQMQEPEPLLGLLTTNHPWVGAAINGPLNAYNNIKNAAPAFVRVPANYVERTVGRPIASGIESVGRAAGIESGVRRYLGERTPSDVDTRPDNKRRRIRDERAEDTDMETDVEKGITSPSVSVYQYRSRAGSQASFAESLPAYDSNRSPPYEAQETPATEQTSTGGSSNGHPNVPQLAFQQRSTAASRRGSSAYGWGQQLLITTSGLGVACSDSSLKSLKYCLNVLSQATDHVNVIMEALKQLLNEYQGAQHHSPTAEGFSEHQAAVAAETARKIRGMGNEIMGTLHKVIDHISRYAGGALPDNASALVRRQLMSVPQRWKVAAQEANAAADGQHHAEHEQGPASPTSTLGGHDDDALRSGTRFVNFAVQGLDMFEQVGLILSATIKSADKWLDTMGRRGSTTATSHAAQQRRASVAQSAPKQQSAFGQHSFVPINGFGAQPYGVQQPAMAHVAQAKPAHEFGSMDVVMGDDAIREKH